MTGENQRGLGSELDGELDKAPTKVNTYNKAPLESLEATKHH